MSEDKISGIVRYLKSKISTVPDIGIVCGSGLGGLADTLTDAITIKYSEMKSLGFPQPTVAGHKGELVFGVLHGKRVVCMKGRFHYYEGNDPATVGLPIRVMAALGIRILLVTNASGGVNPSYNVGDCMIIKDHICFLGLAGIHPLVGTNDARFGPRFPPVGSSVFDKRLQQVLLKTGVEINFTHPLHIGVYGAVSGPSYETPHEIQLIRTVGGDAVGMSTAFEVLTAAHASLPVLGLACITNRCLGPNDNWEAPSHQEVLGAISNCQDDVKELVSSFVKNVDLTDYPRTKAYDYFTKYLESTKDQGIAKLAVVAGVAAMCAMFLFRGRK